MNLLNIFNKKETNIEWLLEQCAYDNTNLGIPANGFMYQKINEKQNASEEFFYTQDFLEEVFKSRVKNEAPELYDPNMNIEFINYGDTQQVFVLNSNGKLWSVLISQPNIEFGIVKKEFDNLKELAINNPNLIVEPKYYFEDGKRELYVAPYIYQARCIASQEHGYGVYIPEPYYRFEAFQKDISKTINTCMIANLIRLYDEEKKQGVGACKIGGGDFILEKSWDSSDKSIETTLQKMKLIAAREMIKMSLDDYEQQLITEFSKRTYYNKLENRNPNFMINHKNIIPMNIEEIHNGIELGRQLRKKK